MVMNSSNSSSDSRMHDACAGIISSSALLQSKYEVSV